jgi:signal transduction histidine kinase
MVTEIALKRAKERISLKAQIKEYTENLEKLVEEKTQKLIEAERLAAVGQTVAGLAHAIKNITGGLTGGIFVLEKGIELDNKKYLQQGREMVEGNVKKIKSMAMDLLKFAKDREPDYQLGDPNRPVEEVFDLMASRAQEYGISLEMDLDKNLPDLWFDLEEIYRCLLNLVTNAIDACAEVGSSGEKGVVVLRSFRPEGWAVEYQVVDNGCGMDEETRAKIFQSFFSTKGSRGTGLGLMITKKIVDEHGGVIEVESQKAKGSKFSIRLPEREKSAES